MTSSPVQRTNRSTTTKPTDTARRTRRFGALWPIAMAAIVAASVGTASSTVSAVARPVVVGPSADLFWCTKDGNSFCTQTKIVTVSGGTPVTMFCWRDDRRPFGPASSPRWFYVWLDNGIEGYIYGDQVGNQSTVRNCSNYGITLATDWALARLGTTGPAPTPTGRWSGYCATFAYKAWEPYGNSLTINSPFNAITWYGQYSTTGNRPGVNGRSRPPRGALVWFAASAVNGNEGHVALSIGNWQMITTQGMSLDAKPIAVKGILDYEAASGSRYLGWSMPNNQANVWFNNNAIGLVP